MIGAFVVVLFVWTERRRVFYVLFQRNIKNKLDLLAINDVRVRSIILDSIYSNMSDKRVQMEKIRIHASNSIVEPNKYN